MQTPELVRHGQAAHEVILIPVIAIVIAIAIAIVLQTSKQGQHAIYGEVMYCNKLLQYGWQ